ncbi:MAG: membrane dipeptidase, partial [Maribacter sp.]|nr:membrane dipeptidase [Maribacter sp.]
MKYSIYICGFLVLLSCAPTVKKAERSENGMVAKIHEKIITIDTHNDINVTDFTDTINYTQRLDTQVNIPKMEEGGLDVSWLIVYTGQDSLNTK